MRCGRRQPVRQDEERQRLQQDAFDNAEDCGIRADADRQRQHGQRGEQRRSNKPLQDVLEIHLPEYGLHWRMFDARNHSEGLRPSDSPTRSLASHFAGSLRSRGLTRALVR